ncbi:hypothetical protein GQ44DRAFT_717522 [Phaeosphaeriaceae sp. PMI808]|nr:hypothetical protein GQ44DRAFT_717522 [Phaeosphaeriaceae sp. PMI808]
MGGGDTTIASLSKPLEVPVPTASGRAQTIVRCPTCFVAVWSHYDGFGRAIACVRAGTLDRKDVVNPDVWIYTGTKQPWVEVGYGKKGREPAEVWSEDVKERFGAAVGRKIG